MRVARCEAVCGLSEGKGRVRHFSPARRSKRLSLVARALAAVVLVGLLSGCQVSKSAFKDEADTVSANFAAAATTLRYLHNGKLTRQYAKASFFNYATVTKGAESTLRSASGAPDQASLNRLLRLYQPAAQAISEPCLDGGCDWRGQVAALEKASGAFREAAKS